MQRKTFVLPTMASVFAVCLGVAGCGGSSGTPSSQLSEPDHSSLTVTTLYQRRLEGQTGESWGKVAEAIGLRSPNSALLP
jgi:hypothetical protein